MNFNRAITVTGFIFLMTACNKKNSPSPQPPPTAERVDTLTNWIKIYLGGGSYNDVFFTDAQTGFLLNGVSILSSTDRGTTWQPIDGTERTPAYNLIFLDSENGYADGANIFQTSGDGGKTWSKLPLPGTASETIQFVSPASGFYTDRALGLFKTSDRGLNWTKITDGNSFSIPFYFLDANNGFRLLGRKFSKTTDGGVTWSLLSEPFAQENSIDFSFRMKFIDALNGYVGSSFGLFKTVDGGNTWNKSLDVFTDMMFPYFLDTQNGYCVTRRTIWKTTDGGQHWEMRCRLADDNISGFSFIDMNTCWASTFKGFLLRMNN